MPALSELLRATGRMPDDCLKLLPAATFSLKSKNFCLRADRRSNENFFRNLKFAENLPIPEGRAKSIMRNSLLSQTSKPVLTSHSQSPRVMKILIDNGGPQFSNLGDLALLVSIYSALKAEWPDAEIFTFAEKPERLEEVLPGAKPVSPYGRSRWSGILALGWLAESYSPLLSGSARLFRNLVSGRPISRLIDLAPGNGQSHELEFARFARFLDDLDLYVWAGGGYLTDHFASLATQFANTLEYRASRGVQSAAFGLGIGPLDRRRIAAAVKGSMQNLSVIGFRGRFFG